MPSCMFLHARNRNYKYVRIKLLLIMFTYNVRWPIFITTFIRVQTLRIDENTDTKMYKSIMKHTETFTNFGKKGYTINNTN